MVTLIKNMKYADVSTYKNTAKRHGGAASSNTDCYVIDPGFDSQPTLWVF